MQGRVECSECIEWKSYSSTQIAYTSVFNFTLTNNLEEQKYTGRWVGGYLALVQSGISRLDVFYLKSPILAVMEMNWLEAFVVGVRYPPDGQ